jgi:hypothetical protein
MDANKEVLWNIVTECERYETVLSGMALNIAPTLLNIGHYVLSVMFKHFNNTLLVIYRETMCM